MNIHNNIYCSLLILGLMACGGGSETENTPVENTAAAEAARTAVKADWMQGSWGISYRISGGDISQNESHVNEYQVAAAVEQIAAIPGIKWLQLNLTNGAFGDRFIVPVAEVEAVNPLSAPNSVDDLHDPNLPGDDLFEQIAIGLQEKGIRVVAYIATQGPGMLKHGAERSMDFDDSIIDQSDGSACKETEPVITDPDTQVYCSANMNRWRDHVLATYPSTSLYHSFQLSLVNIVETLSIRYGNLIDGWWFDHALFSDFEKLPDAARAGNSDAIVALGLAEGTEIVNRESVPEDYTGGHPTPVARVVSSDDTNLPLVTAIEASDNGVLEGIGDDPNAVAHIFFPLQETFNGGTVVFSEAKGTDWLNRVTSSGGAITWALSHEGSVSRGEQILISAPQAKLMTRMQFNLRKQLHMNLDGVDGSTAYDDSVNQYTATVTGTTFVDDITRGKVANFTETDQLTLNNYTGVLGDSARTTMAWIKTSDSAGDIIQWGKDIVGETWKVSVEGGKLEVNLQGSTITATSLLNDDEWHHITVVASDNVIGNIQVYIDGVLETVTVNGSASSTFNTTADANVQIGGEFTGLIDKVVVHDRALAENEIDYVVNSVDADLDLAASLDVRFEDAENSSTVVDSSIYKRHGTNRGATSGVFDATRNSHVYSLSGVDSGVDVDDLYDSDYEHEIVMTTDNRKSNKGYSGVNGGEPRTVMAWIKTTLSGRIIAEWGNKESISGERYKVRLKVGALSLDIQGGTITGTTLVNDGEWHHIAVVSTDENLANTKLYIDGVLETSTALSGTQTTINTLTQNGDSLDVIVGGNFVGEMDDFVIHQRALRQFEIKNAAGL